MHYTRRDKCLKVGQTMADSNKYYYMRLKDGFFEEDAVQIIESVPDGYLYSNILLKLYLKSLKFNGKLMFNERIPYNATVLATITGHQVGTVEKALQLFETLDLIEILDNGAIYMLDIQSLIGKSSTEADRKREYRAKIDAEKAALLGCGQMSGHFSPEIEIDIEKDIDIEIEKDIEIKTEKDDSQDESLHNLYHAIISYLNEKACTNYRASSKKTQSCIHARIKEGFTLEDFQNVIEKKCAEWMGTEFEKFLRPETLFGTKFEGYLNARYIPNQTKSDKIKNRVNDIDNW